MFDRLHQWCHLSWAFAEKILITGSTFLLIISLIIFSYNIFPHKVCNNASTFISDFSNLRLLFFLVSLIKCLSFCYLFRETTFGFVGFPYFLFILYFVYLNSNLCESLLSANFAFSCCCCLLYYSYLRCKAR